MSKFIVVLLYSSYSCLFSPPSPPPPLSPPPTPSSPPPRDYGVFAESRFGAARRLNSGYESVNFGLALRLSTNMNYRPPCRANILERSSRQRRAPSWLCYMQNPIELGNGNDMQYGERPFKKFWIPHWIYFRTILLQPKKVS